MIQGLAKQGEEELAFEVFGSMQRTGVDPDGGTLVSLLSASGHAGFNRRRGLGLFASIARFHNIRPSVHHFNCIADMLGRSGFLGEAEDLLVTLHANGNLVGWLTLLAHCGNRGNAVLGKRCFDQVMGVDCNNAAAHALMSSIYFQANMLGELQELERSRISGHG
jgi:pentatricopeptide repeat protein